MRSVAALTAVPVSYSVWPLRPGHLALAVVVLAAVAGVYRLNGRARRRLGAPHRYRSGATS